MGDTFSNWANRQVDKVRDFSRQIQAGDAGLHRTQVTPQEHRAQQQQQHKQAQSEHAQMEKKGQLPKAQVHGDHVTFSAEAKDSLPGGEKKQGASRAGADKGHATEKRPPADKGHVNSDKHGANSERAEKQNNGGERKTGGRPENQQQGQSEKQSAPKSEVQKQHSDAKQPAKHESTARPQQGSERVAHPEKPGANTQHSERVSRPADAHVRSAQAPSHEAGAARPQARSAWSMNGQEYLKKLEQAMGSLTHPTESTASAAKGIVPKNTPDYVLKGGAKPGGHIEKEAGKGTDSKAPGQKEGTAKESSIKDAAKESKQAAADTTKTKGTDKVAKTTPVEAPSTPEGAVSKPGSAPSSRFDYRSIKSVAGSLVGKGFGVWGVATGISEIKEGVQQFKQGNKVEGTLNTTAGVADVSSGSAAILYSMGKNALGTVALKAGGVGSILSGTAEIHQGFKQNDNEKKFDGGVRLVTGVGMALGSSEALVAGISYSGTRMVMTNVGWGGENLDAKTTRLMDSGINRGVNQELNAIEQNNQKLYEKSQAVVGQDLNSLEASGATRKDMSEAVIGIREQIEKTRAAGQDTEALKQELRRLVEIRGQLSR